MRAAIFLMFGCVLTCLPHLQAEDYLVRLATSGYEDQPAVEKEPTSRLLRSIELLARPGVPFHASLQIDTETLTLAGILTPTQNGKMDLRIHYAFSRTEEDSQNLINGVPQPSVSRSETHTSIALAPGDSSDVGQRNSQKTTPEGNLTVTKTRSVVALMPYQPAEDPIRALPLK